MNIKENYGYTPLNLALINDITEIGKLLQDAGALKSDPFNIPWD